MGYKCIVLAKQVPDTANITGDAMTESGTVNRAALPAIFNPEDLNALEMGLEIKDRYGGEVVLLTMGLPRAGELLREGLCRGADEAILLTDRRAAVSDTHATSYILSCAVRKIGGYDLVICGRQAIDGDTAQVGPQTADKLGLPQITYVEELLGLQDCEIRARRQLGNGYEVLEGPLPMLLTVVGTANEPRPPAARKLMRYKRARAPLEVAGEVREQMPDASDEAVGAEVERRCDELRAKGLLITQWSLDDLDVNLDWCGAKGSPTKVKRIQFIVLTASEYKRVEPTDQGIHGLIHELIEDHTIG